METLDILNLTLSTGTIVLVSFLSYMIYQAIITLKTINSFLDRINHIIGNVESVTDDVRIVKDALKINFLRVVEKLLNQILPANEKQIKTSKNRK